MCRLPRDVPPCHPAGPRGADVTRLQLPDLSNYGWRGVMISCLVHTTVSRQQRLTIYSKKEYVLPCAGCLRNARSKHRSKNE